MPNPQATDVLHVMREGPVITATMNRPHRRNALNIELTEALYSFFRERRRDSTCKVIILRGAGDHFCVGADLLAAVEGDPMVNLIDEGDWNVTDIVRDMRSCPQPVIALANGSVAGGGYCFALAADIILASDTASFCTAFINLGLSGSELGVGWRLQRTIGISLARELMFTAGKLDAAQAVSAGLASRVVPSQLLDAEGLALANKIARYSADALRLTKRNLDLALQSPSIEHVFELEERAQMRCASREDFAEALAGFNAKHGPKSEAIGDL